MEPRVAGDPSTARFLAGDGLRALAAFSVLAWHAGYLTGVERAGFADPLAAFSDAMGWLIGGLQAGVFLFFVLSGYLLARPFTRAVICGLERPPIRRYARTASCASCRRSWSPAR